VYAHIVCPHPPFVFRKDGTFVETSKPYSLADASHLFGDLTPTAQRKYRSDYLEQLEFLNTRVQEAIEDLLAANTGPLVVILQGDHGPGSGLNWDSVEKSDLKERSSILSAYYFSDGDYSSLSEALSPVNTFRTIFRKYFDLDYELLANRSFFSTWALPYVFHEVE